MKTGIELIAEERQEQIEKHGRTVKDDAKYNSDGQLVAGAVMVLTTDSNKNFDSAQCPQGWDEYACEHMIRKSYLERLVIAGALIAAEIDRYNAEK